MLGVSVQLELQLEVELEVLSISYTDPPHQGSAFLQVALYSKPSVSASVFELLTRTRTCLSLPGIRVGALALYHNQMCLEHLY